jgi:hypothetical protein
MIPIFHTCPTCGLEDVLEVTLPRGRDPQEAGSIDPAACCECGTEFDRADVFDKARDENPEEE